MRAMRIRVALFFTYLCAIFYTPLLKEVVAGKLVQTININIKQNEKN